MSSAMIEAVLRSLLLAVAVAAGLRILRVCNVVAQKSAWTLVLGAGLAMPLLLPFAGRWQVLPATATFTLPEHPLSRLANQFAVLWPRPAAHAAEPRAASQTAVPAHDESVQVITSVVPADASSSTSSDYSLSSVHQGTPAGTTPSNAGHGLSLAELTWLAYLCVAVTLLFRLFVGLASALLIWMDGVPVILPNSSGFAKGLHLRASREVSSPVTIGSAVVLPADYADWDTAKLRVVLAHERSHIRQGDFYLQFLAGLYSALTWFSPLGWWLKSKLSDLAETISDRAGLEQASDCSSYAQILLEFAAAPRPTLTGVAMARPGSLSRRIERLLNDRSFRQAFAGGRGRVLAAVLLVPIAFFAATSLLRVKAAQQAPDAAAAPAPVAPAAQAAPPAQAQPAAQEAPITGQANPGPDVDTIAAPSPDQASPAPPASPAPAPAAPATPAVAPGSPAPAAPAAPSGRVIVVPRVPGRVVVVPNVSGREIVVPEIPAMTIRVPDNGRIMALVQKSQGFSSVNSSDSSHNGWAHSSYFNDGEYYAVVTGNWDNLGCCTWMNDRRSAFEKIRKQAHGDFLWFNRDGKDYYVDDPASIAQIEAMYKPMDALGKQQEELGRKQEELGKQQEALGRQQEQASVPTPNISKEMAELNAAMAKLQAKMGKTVTQDELADLEAKLGDLQGRLGEIQGEIGAKQGAFGDQQGRLGEEQGRLGEEQGTLARDADHTVRSIIDESLRNGKAHPVE